MPRRTKIFRVFVSSTFTDMKEERRILQKEVFPKLEKYCEENDAKFQAVDLRWGVNEESQLNQKTLDICLNEIARCQKVSPKPNFIILLGDKYGWQPIPPKIPVAEIQKILEVNATDPESLLKKWYKLDENAVPAEYVLQARDRDYKEYSKWETVEAKIRKVLRTAVEKLSFPPEQKEKYFASATHLEILTGAFNPPEGTEKPEEHVFAFIRHIEFLPRDKRAEGYIDLLDDKPSVYCEKQLEKLKSDLKKKLGDHFIPYNAQWREGKSVMNDPNWFAEKAFNSLKGVIEAQLKKTISVDEIEHEIKLHTEFKEGLTSHFIGRASTLQEIKDYLANSSEQKVLSLVGDSGSGKSSIMAQAAKLHAEENPTSLTLFRFIGTTSRSSNILSLLLSICGQIAKEYNVTLESLAGEEKERSLYEIQGLSEVFSKCLALGKPEKPITVFLDALDQLADSENTHSLFWIPRVLPPNAKIIVSSLPEIAQQLQNTRTLQAPVLPEQEASQILDRWLTVANRKLKALQTEEVVTKFKQIRLPIYLKLAFEQAKHWHSYDEDISLQSDIKGILNNFFEYLEKEHTEEFVRAVVCYMLCGKYQGLTENEILEILVFDKEYWNIFLEKTHEEHKKELDGVTKIPVVVWSRLFYDLEPFLTERDADGVPIITFFHRQFNEILGERYQLVDEDLKINKELTDGIK